MTTNDDADALRTALAAVERKIASLADQIAAGDAKLEPLEGPLAEACARVQAAQLEVDRLAAEYDAARGDVQAWLALKRRHGQLAATRMEMRRALRDLEGDVPTS